MTITVTACLRIIGIIFLILISVPAYAGYVEAVKVRYHNNYDVTRWTTVDVEFVTGSEISSRVSGYFPFNNNYAIVPLKNEKVVVLKLDGINLCSVNFTISCFPLSGTIRAYDKNGQAWEFCRSSFCY